MTNARTGLAVTLALLISACGGGGTASRDQSAMDDGGAEDLSRTDDEACPASASCQSSSSCGGFICQSGTCAACSSDDACAGDSVYGASSRCIGGVCQAVTACLGDAKCPAIDVANDAPSSGPLRGYADPSLRRALDGTTLFMGYSYPTTVSTSSGAVLSIDAHLATSTDNGGSWSLVRALFASTAAETAPGLGVQGVSSSEEISIAPAALDPSSPSTHYWISSRQKYWNPLPGAADMGAAGLHDTTTHLRIGMVQSDSPSGLGDGEANEEVLIEENNPSAFATAIAPTANKRSLAEILSAGGHSDCELAWSTSILYVAPYVYLAVECTQATAAASDIVLLRTQPYASGAVQPPTSWEWTFVGHFGTASDAALLSSGGNEVIQPELDRLADGSVVLVATPDNTSAGGVRLGCNVVRMESLDPPALTHVCDGLETLYADRTPDLAPGTQFGEQAGSCSFEQSVGTHGLVQARKSTQAGVAVSTLNVVTLP